MQDGDRRSLLFDLPKLACFLPRVHVRLVPVVGATGKVLAADERLPDRIQQADAGGTFLDCHEPRLSEVTALHPEVVGFGEHGARDKEVISSRDVVLEGGEHALGVPAQAPIEDVFRDNHRTWNNHFS